MKVREILVAGALTVAFTAMGLAQHMHSQTSKEEDKSSKQDMMGKPIAEQGVEGVRVQLWVIPQDEHKKMMQVRMQSGTGDMTHDMSGMKDSAMSGHKMQGGMGHDMARMDHSKMQMEANSNSKGMNHAKSMEAMMSGTHRVMVKLLDEKSGKALGEGHVMINVTDPSGKDAMVHLALMKDHFGGGASFAEMGQYKLALSFKAGDKSGKAQFQYEVK